MTTNTTLPLPNPRNAQSNPANQSLPLPPRNPAPPPPPLPSQNHDAPSQNLQTAFSMPPRSLQIPRLLQITLSSVRHLHPIPLLPTSTCFTDTLLNPSAALQSTAEDFLHSLSQSAGPAQAELINCILRACGCNDSIDADQVIDYDGVVDSLDNFTEGLKQVTYPSTLPRHCSSPLRKTRPYIPSLLNCLLSNAFARPSRN